MSIIKPVERWPLLRSTRIKTTKMLRAADGKLTSQLNWIIAIAVLAVLQTALIFNHQPWLDEYQAVQLAVEAQDIGTLMDWLAYEGHPPLYYFILRGMAHLMEPLWTLPVLALILAVITQSAILFGSPFTRVERLLIASSQFVLFDYLTLSRSNNLGLAFMVLIMVFWRSRFIWVLIALLPMCDFLFGVISGIFVLMKWRQNELWWPGVALWLIGGLAAAYTVIPAADVVPAGSPGNPIFDFAYYTGMLGTQLFPFQGGIIPRWNMQVRPVGGILAIGFLMFMWTQVRGRPFGAFLLFGFTGLTFVFSMFVYPLATRHIMLVSILLILLTWHWRIAGDRPKAGFRLWLTLAAFCGLVTSAINFSIPFHNAQGAADEIERLGLTDKHWVSFPESRGQGVSALTGIEFERTELHCMQSFIRWNHSTELREKELLEAYLREEVARHGRFYLLSDIEFEEVAPDVLRQISKIERGYDPYNFYLYVVGYDADEREVDLPDCAPGRREFKQF